MDSGWTGTVEDSAGVTIVRNPATGMWRPSEEWTVDEELRIGAVEGEPAYEFGVVLPGAIAVDSHRQIYVLDSQAQEIRLFSGEGEHIRTLTAKGNGPGELASARDLLMGPGDTLFVPDWRTQRMSRFAPDGSFGGDSRFWPRKEGLSIAFRTNGSGLIVEQVGSFVYGTPEPENPRDALVRWASGRVRSDTLALVPTGQDTYQEGGFIGTVWYAPVPCWDLTEDGGILFGMNDQYRFRLISPEGEVDRIVTRAYEPRPVSDRDIERAMSHMEDRWKRMGASPSNMTRLVQAQHFSEFLPAYQSLYEGPSGTIWVQKTKPPSEMAEDETLWFTWPSDWATQDWDVFDAEGRYLGVVTMPPRFTPSVFRGDEIYGVALDEVGVSYVVRLRVVRTGRGPGDASGHM
ncbi:MAG: hypothetical protein LJF04_03800 [Gemmatimonadetes bacterium]|nr:hypothetical protein [Gemmatimonadota bacterium]